MQEQTPVNVAIAAILQGGFFSMKNRLGARGFEEVHLRNCCRLAV
jgi:hypothetical protein